MSAEGFLSASTHQIFHVFKNVSSSFSLTQKHNISKPFELFFKNERPACTTKSQIQRGSLKITGTHCSPSTCFEILFRSLEIWDKLPLKSTWVRVYYRFNNNKKCHERRKNFFWKSYLLVITNDSYYIEIFFVFFYIDLVIFLRAF